MITGSHITADLNGVKLFINGEEISKIHELEIENYFQIINFTRGRENLLDFKFCHSNHQI